MKTLYQTKARTIGGREGNVKTEDGNLNLFLSIPKSLGGEGKIGATNPEQLFAAGYSACFESAIRHMARTKKVKLSDVVVEAEVGLIAAEVGFALIVSLKVFFTQVELELAQELVALAHQVCPYSNALKNNVDVKISVQVLEELVF